MTPSDYLRAVRTRWLLIVLCGALGAAAAGGYSLLQTPTYEASVQMFVSASTKQNDVAQLNQAGLFGQQRVKSYAVLVKSRDVTEAVVTSLDLPYSAQQLAQRITVSSPLDTVLLDITVADESPQRASDVANQVAAEFGGLVDRIETPPGEKVAPVRVTVTQTATPPGAPVGAKRSTLLALGAVLGLAFGAGCAVLRHTLDRRLRYGRAAGEAAGATLLGEIVNTSLSGGRLIADHEKTKRAEAFRKLATNVRHLAQDWQIHSLVLTSAHPGEGSTVTAANLAVALAQTGQAVVLVDADLREPSLAELFHLGGDVGLSQVLRDQTPVEDALKQWRPDLPLRLLPAGPVPAKPSELLASVTLTKLVESFRASETFVIFDAPAVLPYTDAAILARAADGAVLVTRLGVTRADRLSAAAEELRVAGATVLGVIARGRIRQA